MNKRKVVLTFPHKLVDKPITYHLVKDYDLVVNIMKARVGPNEQGLLVVELEGQSKNLDKGIKYLKDIGVEVQSLNKDIRWNKKKCTHCTACVAICPTNAIEIDREKMEINFNKSKCIACELCVEVCPYDAVDIIF